MKKAERLREKGARLKDENVRLQKALENACQPQVEDVKSFLELADGAGLAGEKRLSGCLDLLEKIQKRYPEFVFSLEDLVGKEEEEQEAANQGEAELTPTTEVPAATIGEHVAEPRGPEIDADVENVLKKTLYLHYLDFL